MGWTNPPEPSRSPWRSAVRVTAIAAGSLVVLLLIGIGILVVAFFQMGSQLGPKDVDLYRPTDAESLAAATTVPIAPAGCVAFARVERATAAAADATAFLIDPRATAAEAQVALESLHDALDSALGPAAGPMRRRLVNVDTEVGAAQRALAGWHGVIPDDSSTAGEAFDDIRDRAYTQLRIAERLLGPTCGGHLAPSAERVLFGRSYASLTSTATAPRGRVGPTSTVTEAP